jgi:hypothetical protein
MQFSQIVLPRVEFQKSKKFTLALLQFQIDGRPLDELRP